jgi:hypothetical protein
MANFATKVRYSTSSNGTLTCIVRSYGVTVENKSTGKTAWVTVEPSEDLQVDDAGLTDLIKSLIPMEQLNEQDVQSFDQAPDGLHVVDGVTFRRVDGEDPVYVEKDGELKILTEFHSRSADTNPVAYLTPPEVLGLALAFGAKLPRQITAQTRTNARFLLLIEEAINKTGKTLSLSSKNGWINQIPGMNPPAARYYMKFVGATRPDRKPDDLSWQAGQYGDSLIFEFKIVKDFMGKPTIWEGFTVGWFVNNPFAEQQADGMLRFARNENGKVSLDAQRMAKFIEHFAPDVYDHTWITDPTESPHAVNELVSPQYVIVHEALAAGNEVEVPCAITKKGRFVPQLDQIGADDIFEDVDDLPDVDVDEGVEQPSNLMDLVDLLETVSGETQLFEQSDSTDLVLTDAGKEWMRENIAGPWERAGLPKDDRRLTVLKTEQVTKLLEELKKQFSTESTDW